MECVGAGLDICRVNENNATGSYPVQYRRIPQVLGPSHEAAFPVLVKVMIKGLHLPPTVAPGIDFSCVEFAL
jgi:hypothetical protein